MQTEVGEAEGGEGEVEEGRVGETPVDGKEGRTECVEGKRRQRL